jgi:predicted metal-dependent hydrolase
MTQPATVPPRAVRTRRIAFSYPPASLDRHYVAGDLVMSHVVSVLSAMFPPGEDYFVRSVRHFAGQVTDPELTKQVAGFIGQEVTHGREHRTLNERLQQLGYPTRRVDRMVTAGLRRNERMLPPGVRLAMTAALEHYTATLAETLLTDPRAQALLGETEVRSMLLWHALEESEHKAVAFDVLRQVVGDERLRIRVMRLTTFAFLLSVAGHTALSLLGDRAAYDVRRLARSLADLRHSPFLSRDVIRRIRDYNRVGFHPDDNDASALLERWRTELFGAEGRLTDHLR